MASPEELTSRIKEQVALGDQAVAQARRLHLEQILNAVVNAARADALGHSYFGCHCVDCGVNTAPAIWRGGQVEPALPKSWEFYWVKDKVWAAAGMGELDGSLCVGCIEARLGRRLRPKDFDFRRDENRTPSNWITPRLAARRGDAR